MAAEKIQVVQFMKEYQQKCEALHKRMEAYARQDMAVAFSGGVDSALLLKLAVLHGNQQNTRVYAITASTDLHPLEDEALAEKVAVEMGARHHILKIKELEEAGILENPRDRCYRCKRFLFQKIKERAKCLGAELVIEGTNSDDLNSYRPGLKAIEELEIRSPLKEAGFRKEQVRKLAAEYGISVAGRPSAPCLATRFPYGTHLTREKFKQAEKGEIFLKSLGLYNVRLRVHDHIARIEIDPVYMETLLAKREEVVNQLKNLGYSYITLDLEGFRSGSMDLGIKNTFETDIM
jgi:uncharacterized protein